MLFNLGTMSIEEKFRDFGDRLNMKRETTCISQGILKFPDIDLQWYNEESEAGSKCEEPHPRWTLLRRNAYKP